MLHEIGAALAAMLAVLGGVIRRYVLVPIRTEATQAMSQAQENADRLNRLEQLLVGSDAESDDGQLVRLEDKIDEVQSQLREANRLETERTYNIQQVVKALARSDDFEVEEREDGYVFYERGGEGRSRSDGGILFTHRDPNDK